MALTRSIRLAFRRLRKQKQIAVLNFIGLGIGFACCIAIGLYLTQERSFDTFHSKADRIYRLDKIARLEGQAEQKHAVSSGGMKYALEGEIPEVENIVRMRPWFTDMLLCRNGTNCQTFADVTYADNGFFQMFDFPLIAGDTATALREPFSIVLSENTARALFGNENPIGQTLQILHDMPVTITGIAATPPANSSIHFTALVSWSSTYSQAYLPKFSFMNNWLTQVNFTYVLLREGTDPEALKPKMAAILAKNLPERANSYTLYLQPLRDIHLGTADVLYAVPDRLGNGRVVSAIGWVGLLVLLIACFNFVNLASVAARERVREVGILKIMGSGRAQIAGQFCLDSLLLSCAALASAWAINRLGLPYFDRAFDLQLTQSLATNPQVPAFLGIGLLGAVLFAGLFPALASSRFQMTDALKKGIGREARSAAWWRGGLVTLQFTFSIILIIGTLVVGHQTSFLLQKDLGFDRENLLALHIGHTQLKEKSGVFLEALRQHAGISAATVANRAIWQPLPGYGIIPEGRSKADALQAKCIDADAHFAQTNQLKLLTGRLPDPQTLPTDSSALLINETFARTYGWTPETALDKKVEIIGEQKGRIVGVVRDFNSSSLREAVEPILIQLRHNPTYITLRIKPSQTAAVLDFCKTAWQRIEAKHPFDFAFADDRIHRFYQSDLRLLGLLRLFSGIAIFVACLGLFGLTAFATQQRTKEIGIRKVLGASVTGITGLLAKDFLKLVVIAIMVASPVAYFFMQKWLSDFAYRIELQWWMFAGAGAAAVGIAFLTVGFQSVRAALANPVKSLRSE
jgi:putative ABC transport system permease protein